MKKSKHLKIVARRVEQATSEAVADEQLRQITIRDTARTQRLEQQQREDIALINAGMIPLRVLSSATVPGSEVIETQVNNGAPVETVLSFTVRGQNPALYAAIRAIATRDR